MTALKAPLSVHAYFPFQQLLAYHEHTKALVAFIDYYAASTTNNGAASRAVSESCGEGEAAGNLSLALVWLTISHRVEISGSQESYI
jgi:hypothetical protein